MQKEMPQHDALLFEAILTLKDEGECRAFFQDLCTVAELRAMEIGRASCRERV